MTHISRTLITVLVAFTAFSVMMSAHAGIVIKGNIDLPHWLDHSILLSNSGVSQRFAGPLYHTGDRQSLEYAIEPVPQVAPGEVVPPTFLPGLPNLDSAPDAVKSPTSSTEEPLNIIEVPQSGPEPYVMLLAGLGMIVVAITLHLKSTHQARSSFKPSQGMPFV